MKGQFFGLKSDMNGPMMPEVVPMLKEGSVTRGSLRPESPLHCDFPVSFSSLLCLKECVG